MPMRHANTTVLHAPVLQFMGVVIGSAVFPIAFALTWAKCSAAGAISGALVGLCGAVITWTVTAKCLYEEVTIDTLGKE